jgi:hypothetical protein
MNGKTRNLVATCALMLTTAVQANTPVDALLQEYQQQATNDFSATAGEAFWNQSFRVSGTNEDRSCATCHTAKVQQTGKHAVTTKEIKPLAPSVLSKRLTNPEKIRKWLKRNCEWTLGRECTAQEKGDVLMFLKNQ